MSKFIFDFKDATVITKTDCYEITNIINEDFIKKIEIS